MLCAISGEAPQVPVASRKSGHVFEKRLIEAYIAENGKDPVTGEEIATDDLVELRSARIVKPRPPTLTSIPSLLSVFQNEWDALALETYNLRQHLTQTRQELSTALYQHDAAVRVIARLSKERDEAREALSKITMNGGGMANGEAMQVDGPELSSDLVDKVEATQEKLSKTRRKRAVPDDWVTPEAVQLFQPVEKSKPLFPGARSLSADESGDLVLLGGDNGVAGVYSVSQNKVVQELEVGSGAVTDAIWAGARAIVSTSSGVIKIFEDGAEISSFNGHRGKVTALALHPSGDILASVGTDKSYILYDLASYTQATQVYTDAELTRAGFHPDGHLFAAGGSDGQIKIFDVKTGANAANFDGNGAVQALAFSENGTWLAIAVRGSTSVSIWDLRKSSQIKVLDIGGQIENVLWDYTGQFLVVTGPSGLSVQQYSKSAKEWSEPLRSAVPAVAVAWGAKAQQLISLSAEGIITLLGTR